MEGWGVPRGETLHTCPAVWALWPPSRIVFPVFHPLFLLLPRFLLFFCFPSSIFSFSYLYPRYLLKTLAGVEFVSAGIPKLWSAVDSSVVLFLDSALTRERSEGRLSVCYWGRVYVNFNDLLLWVKKAHYRLIHTHPHTSVNVAFWQKIFSTILAFYLKKKKILFLKVSQ